MRRRLLVTIMAVAAFAGAIVAGQSTPPSPPQQGPTPSFNVAVEFVEVAARVLDKDDHPVPGLTKADFQLFESGVRQDITTFAEVNLPPPVVAPVVAGAKPPAPADVTTNRDFNKNGRIYMLLFEENAITAARTNDARRIARSFIEKYVGTNDLVAVGGTGYSGLGYSLTFQNFTSDKSLMLAAVNKVVGYGSGSPTVQRLNSIEYKSGTAEIGGQQPAPSTPITQDSRIQDVQRAQETVARAVRYVAAMPGSKAILLVGEGAPFDRLTMIEDFNSANELQQAFQIAARGNVPIYTVDPRGNTDGSEELIGVGKLTAADADASPRAAVLNEIRSSQELLRNLAFDTGGMPIVATNNFDRGFGEVVARSSSYYVLGYTSKNPKKDGTYRMLDVRVARPGLHVVARRGYLAPKTEAPAKTTKAEKPTPMEKAGASPALRDALNKEWPLGDIRLSLATAAFKGTKDASVAVVVEADGNDLALTEKNGSFTGPLEIVVSALDANGNIKTGDTHQLTMNFSREQYARVREQGMRWLTRLDVKPGKYQLRVAVVSGGKAGSVWHDLVVPDFSKNELAISQLLVSSEHAFAAPTLKPDPVLHNVIGPPTTLRAFPSSDTVTLFAELYDTRGGAPHQIDSTLIVRRPDGSEVARQTQTRSTADLQATHGVARETRSLRVGVLPAGDYEFTLEANIRGAKGEPVSRTIPVRVVP